MSKSFLFFIPVDPQRDFPGAISTLKLQSNIERGIALACNLRITPKIYCYAYDFTKKTTPKQNVGDVSRGHEIANKWIKKLFMDNESIEFIGFLSVGELSKNHINQYLCAMQRIIKTIMLTSKQY